MLFLERRVNETAIEKILIVFEEKWWKESQKHVNACLNIQAKAQTIDKKKEVWFKRG